jgi:hypothetical protein
MSDSIHITPDPNMNANALEIARALARAGVPIFVAKGVPGKPGEFKRPTGWQNIRPDPSVVNAWRPGDALCAVGGGPADWLDCDAYNGGAASRDELVSMGAWPTSYGQQRTPSGGTHDVIVPLRTGSKDDVMHGLDLKGGRADGTGRGYIYLAPTAKPSKVAPYELGTYEWTTPPDMARLAEWVDLDDSGEILACRITSSRERAQPEGSTPDTTSDVLFATDTHSFTTAQAVAFCQPFIDALREAKNGQIRARLSEAALVLARFRDVWSETDRTRFLVEALALTAYDGRTWRAEPCIAECFGSPKIEWQATHVVTVDDPPPVPEPDAVDRLLAEMLDVDAVLALPPPVPLIRDVLDMDSESWLISKAGGFKSFVALDMACHVVLGRAWRGQLVRQGPVVYVVAEGRKSIGLRVQAWIKTYGEKPAGLHILPRPVQVKDANGWAVLVEACRRIQPVGVILDTQARITVGLSENDNGEMGVLTEAVRRLKEATGACVLVVHHQGRSGDDARGASAIDGAQDTELKVVRPDGKDRSRLTGTLVMDKQKDAAEDVEFEFQMRVVDLGVADDGRKLTSLALAPISADPFDSLVRSKPEPDWEENLTVNMTDVLAAMRAASDETGATGADIRAWIKNLRSHEGRPDMTRTSFHSAVRDLKRREVVVAKGARYYLAELLVTEDETD